MTQWIVSKLNIVLNWWILDTLENVAKRWVLSNVDITKSLTAFTLISNANRTFLPICPIHEGSELAFDVHIRFFVVPLKDI